MIKSYLEISTENLCSPPCIHVGYDSPRPFSSRYCPVPWQNDIRLVRTVTYYRNWKSAKSPDRQG